MKASKPLGKMAADGRKRSSTGAGRVPAPGGATRPKRGRSEPRPPMAQGGNAAAGSDEEQEVQDPAVQQAQDLSVYLAFLRSDKDYVVQIDMELEHAGRTLYALPGAAYCRNSGACTGIMVRQRSCRACS
jgi:hypothetical protein